ncbi:hypothetical protein BAE44_0000206, partial [Dichanthelium oligosanthes]
LGMHCFPMCGNIQFYPSDRICRRPPASLQTSHTVCEIGAHLPHPPKKKSKIRREDPSREACCILRPP